MLRLLCFPIEFAGYASKSLRFYFITDVFRTIAINSAFGALLWCRFYCGLQLQVALTSSWV